MNIEEAEKLLNEVMNDAMSDDERFHSVYDNIIEERLMELDPKFMVKMKEIYKESGMGRWYA